MKPHLLTILLSALLVTLPNALPPQQPAEPDTAKIIAAFTAKEAEFRNALAQYSYKREAVAQTFGAGRQISGEYNRTSRLTFDDAGKRIEKILFFPMPTLTAVRISSEDLEALGGVQLFALETSKAGLYNFKYVGKERIDELDLHVFDVTPKSIPDAKKAKERFFQGRIWVDTQGFQIVKTKGKAVPELKENPFPTFEVYREEIDGFWFPTYAYADEELILPSGYPLTVRMRIKFSEFEKVISK